MSDYNINIKEYFETIKKGNVMEFTELTGGLMHKTFKVKSESGIYVVKGLNPDITKRVGVLEKLEASERFAEKVKKEINAVSALDVNGKVISEVDGQYYMIFHYVEAVSKFYDEINNVHVMNIGEALAAIHRTDFQFESEEVVRNEYPWEKFKEDAMQVNTLWGNLYLNNLQMIIERDKLAIHSERSLKKSIFSHRDLDPKNVIWKDDSPYLIDWEAAGAINPVVDLIDTGVYWSEGEDSELDMEKFENLIQGYIKAGGTIHLDSVEKALFGAFESRLGWLFYSLTRAFESSEKKVREEGAAHVQSTIKSISKLQGSLEKMKSIMIKLIQNQKTAL